MKAPDIDSLEARHLAEEAAEAARSLIDTPRPMGLVLPKGGHMPASQEWLARLYEGDRVVREKKPQVFDHLRSFGPWMVSIDDVPLSVLDSMSQTATLVGGFAEDTVVRGYFEGELEGTIATSADTTLGDDPAAEAMARTLRRLVPGLPHVAYANSGAEANEKAMALCRLHAKNPAAHRILAFEGGFHGRTLYALHATHSPSKRKPFEIAGYEVTFAPFPVWSTPNQPQPAAPAGFYAAAASGDVEALQSRFGGPGADPLLAAEVASLVAVHKALAQGDHFAVTIEPMQSEGGDRYATNRYFRALRLLTRHHGVYLIMDEVQTGFGLGGWFAWFHAFELIDHRGEPDLPDALVFAKRAQLGVVMSRFEDPEPTAAHPASLVRGRLHAEMMAAHGCAYGREVERMVWPRLEAIARAYPHLVESPRACGYAFAFELPTPACLNAFVNQRFWRGAVVFAAGTRTARYRLSTNVGEREIELLFEAIRRSLSWVDAHPDAMPPAWDDHGRPAGPAAAQEAAPAAGHQADAEAAKPRVRTLEPAAALAMLPAILAMEQDAYEPARRTPEAEFRAAMEHADGVTVVAEVRDGDGWRLVGFAVGGPLELERHVEGPDRDINLGRHNSLYSVSITVAGGHQGMGLGRMLKEAQLRAASSRKDAQGGPRYRYVTGRNRVGHADAMMHINRMYGAHVVCVLTGQYGDPEGKAIYYRIPLGPHAPEAGILAERRSTSAGGTAAAKGMQWDLASGLCQPLAEVPASLRAAEETGLLYGPAVNKITLMNYATTALVRALEWVGALMPELPHMYITSCRDECFDKALRILRSHRKHGQVVIGLEGGYVGHTSGAARSLSDPAVHAQGPAVFAWPRVPHPAVAGVEATCAAIRQAVAAAGGPDKVLGLFYEVVQERTGRVAPAEFWPALAKLASELDLPLVAMETASAGYRNGQAPFATSTLPIRPDILTWWSGAQTGYMHVASRFFVPAPLTMVSTWDGDELSLVRHHHQLRAIRKLDLGEGVRALDAAMEAALAKGLETGGQGLYRVIRAGERADAVVQFLGGRGIRVRRFANNALAVIPPLDRARAAAEALRAALEAM